LTHCGNPFVSLCLGPNDKGNPAAAKNLRFQNTPDPPLGLTALFGKCLCVQSILQPGTAASN
jgi:hypothetical protein